MSGAPLSPHEQATFEALKQRANRIGVELSRLQDATILASKWNLHRCFASTAEARAWLDRIGAPQ